MLKKLIFLVAAITSAIAVAYFVRNRVVRGSGHIVTRKPAVDPFTRVRLRNAKAAVEIARSDTHHVEIEADDNLIDRIATESKDGALTISFQSGVELILPSAPIVIRVGAPALTALHIDGKDRARLGALQAEQFDLVINGVATVDGGPITAQTLRAEINGVAQCRLAGAVTDHHLTVNGVAKYDGLGIDAQHAQVTVNGIGDVKVTAHATLHATLDGNAKVAYAGSPVVTKKVSGGGKIMSLAESAARHNTPAHAT